MTDKETLEEAADTYAKKQYGNSCGAREERKISKEDFIAGAKWQSEKMYSEEEIFNLCKDFAIFVQQKRPSYKKQLEWFEQFKLVI